jgi:VWFA-related protein
VNAAPEEARSRLKCAPWPRKAFRWASHTAFLRQFGIVAVCFLLGSFPGTSQAQNSGQQPSPQQTKPAQKQASSPPAQDNAGPQGAQQDPQDELLTLRRQVNFVEVPVTVKDAKGQLVSGLQKSDFQVYEEGQLQQISFFTADPLPMSVAILVDVGVPDVEISKVQSTLTAMIGAFSAFDEVAVYQFSNTVSRMSDYQTVGDFTGYPLHATLEQLKKLTGATGGVPVTSGPMQVGPTVSGAPVNTRTGEISTVPATTGTINSRQTSRVLNDAIMAAVRDLAQRPRERRKILFVLSDGTEFGSQARDDEVLRALLSYPISVFAVGIGKADLPVYRELGKNRVSTSNVANVLPSLGLGRALPRYAQATGGEVFPAYDQMAIERAYNEASEQARYRYTLGYHSPRPAPGYHAIEVRVDRPGLRVLARQGYYPTPATP